MRIYRDRVYVLANFPGISGYKDWSRLAYRIGSGKHAANNRTEAIGELRARSGLYRLQDGHLPDYQPRVGLDDALAWIQSNPYQTAVPVDTEIPEGTRVENWRLSPQVAKVARADCNRVSA